MLDHPMCAQLDNNGFSDMVTAHCLIATRRKLRFGAHRLIVPARPEQTAVRPARLQASAHNPVTQTVGLLPDEHACILALNAKCMHNTGMSTVTIRDVPDEVRDSLANDARERGQSLQAFLLGLLKRQAAFGRNKQLLAEVERDLSAGDLAGPDAPDAADLIEQARSERDTEVAPNPSTRRRRRAS
jgi:antitoxin FitA